MKLVDLPQEVIDAVEDFPTNSHNLLRENSYFRHVFSYLVDSKRFLEIGYRKGMWVEVCKVLNVRSTHIDKTNKLLRAKATNRNKCYKISSINFLSSCVDQFDLIFQDGSKEYEDRKREYEYIVENEILKPGHCIIVDDLHYPDCMKAFKEAAKKFGFEAKTFSVAADKGDYVMGTLRSKE